MFGEPRIVLVALAAVLALAWLGVNIYAWRRWVRTAPATSEPLSDPYLDALKDDGGTSLPGPRPDAGVSRRPDPLPQPIDLDRSERATTRTPRDTVAAASSADPWGEAAAAANLFEPDPAPEPVLEPTGVHAGPDLPEGWYVLQPTDGAEATALDPEQVLTVGRSQRDADVVCPQSDVSRRHCQLEWDPDGYWVLIDLNSTNGTFVNDEQVTPDGPIALQEGDLVRLGRVYTMVVERS